MSLAVSDIHWSYPEDMETLAQVKSARQETAYC
jgi:hypothetical protein